MLWAALSILSGFGDAVSFASIKKIKNMDAFTKLAAINLIMLPFLLLGFIFYDIPEATFNFYIVIALNVAVFLTAQFVMIKSLELSDLSMSVPMLSFTPIFLFFTSYVLVGEAPNFLGYIGVVIIVFGSYFLNIKSVTYGYLEPLKMIFRDKGVFYMLIVAFLFSITANLAKIGIGLSNPAYFMFTHYLFTSILLTILFFRRLMGSIKSINKNFKPFITFGIAAAFSEILAGAAFKLAIVPYVISLKRTSVVFSVILGFLLFKEKNFKEAMIGSVTMFIGVVLITLS
ncbi:DMT family transporter [Candidatus Woesearchaeota archaeon]|nr:DMT family transporter [Candidatus Woesearchaeota archaeon]